MAQRSPTIWSRIQAAWKVATGQIVWPGGPGNTGVVYETYGMGGPWWDKLLRDQGLDSNSMVEAVTGWVARNFTEAPLRVWDRIDGSDEVVEDHPLALLIEQPNPYYSGALLWMPTLVELFLDGNAYWLKVRNGRSAISELWWIPAHLVEPKWGGETSYIDYYEYKPNGRPQRLEQRDVIHFRYGLDPNNPRKGRSPLRTVMREVMTDEEAELFTQSILHNLGVPGVVMSPEEDIMATDKELEEIKQRFMERFGNTRRGEPLVLSHKTNVQVLSFSPDQMNLRDLRRIPEERVTAVVGLPAIVAGLGAGLDRSTFANYAEAREAAYESLIIPLQRLLAAEIKSQLLPDFDKKPRRRVGFDLSEVRVLQEDQDKLAKRVVDLVKGGVMTPNEGRAKVSLPPADDPDADLRLVDNKLAPVPLEKVEPPPEPTPPPPSPLALPMPMQPVDTTPQEQASLPEQERKALQIQRSFAQVRQRQIRTTKKSALRILKTVEAAVLDAVTAKADADVVVHRVNMSRQLKRAFEPAYTATLNQTYSAIKRAYPQASGRVTVSMLNSIIRKAATRIDGMEVTTIREVREAVRQTLTQGGSKADLAAKLREMGTFSDERADVIANTEMAMASNEAATAIYKASPEFEGVTIHDEEGCAPDGPCVGWNGRELTFDEAESTDTAFHPNCTQMRSPLLVGKRLRASLVETPSRNGKVKEVSHALDSR